MQMVGEVPMDLEVYYLQLLSHIIDIAQELRKTTSEDEGKIQAIRDARDLLWAVKQP